MNDLQNKLKLIPHKPGCYLWKDFKDRIIYVGKAKNLFKRTHQYFSTTTNNRTMQLVSEIRNVDYIIVNSNKEAMILENNLIKKHRPKFNVLLKEGSGYPYIQITNEKNPKFIYTRNLVKSRGKYYGPFPDGTNAYKLLGLLNSLFPLRKCPTVPTKKCIYYDIGQCLGPCINPVTESQYEEIRQKVDELFKGNNQDIVNDLIAQEKRAAESLDFESAQKYKDLQTSIKEAANEQNMELRSEDNKDVIGFYEANDLLAIVIFSYFSGKLLTKHQEILEMHDETSEIIVSYLMQYYSKNRVPKEIFLSINDEDFLSNTLNVPVTNPSKGQMQKIMETAIQNAKQMLSEKIDLHSKQKAKTLGATMELAKLLNIESAEVVEIFDNSNIQGTNSIGAMVVYKNGQKSRDNYRKFNINTVAGANDPATFKEVLYRRYYKLLSDNLPLPDLIIVDGGTPQVRAAKETLDSLYINVPLIGLAKNEKHRTDKIVKSNLEVVDLDKNSKVYFLLANMQEEVHRYAISFFRDKQLKSLTKSFLSGISGLGKTSQEKLLNHFDNVQAIKNASIEELSQFVPSKVAQAIKEKAKSNS